MRKRTTCCSSDLNRSTTACLEGMERNSTTRGMIGMRLVELADSALWTNLTKYFEKTVAGG
jgi:hypothetical protein